MIILGLNFSHDGSACVVKDGRLVAALASERVSRSKKQFGVDLSLIQAVLQQAGVTLKDVGVVTTTDYMPAPDSLIVRFFDHQNFQQIALENRGDGKGIYLPIKHDDFFREVICEIDGHRFRSFCVRHQLSHCASAFFTSPFEKAACLSMDASMGGWNNSSLFAVGSDLDLNPVYCPELLIGFTYSFFTEALGLGDHIFKAGSTMGLAAYGQPQENRFYPEFIKNGKQRRISDPQEFSRWMWSQLTGKLPLGKLKEIDSLAMNTAATLQKVFEEVLVNASKTLFEEMKQFHEGQLCLSGGSLLNCNANSRIYEESGFKNVHLFPGCGDDGTAVGSALFVAHTLIGFPRQKYEPKDLCYLGPAYSSSPLSISATGLGESIPLDLDYIADCIADGKVVGWFQGRSEFGPRALGNRSILADPRNPKMRDYLNSEVKKREWFRPFGPSVLIEDASEWFDLPHASPFMLFTAKARFPEKVPAICHVDHSARPQTVVRTDNPKFYDLIAKFKSKTGVPMILNTSFNLGGEPLVETPTDAISAFCRSKLDVLVLEDRVYFK